MACQKPDLSGLLQTRDTHLEAVELSVVRALNHTAISIPDE